MWRVIIAINFPIYAIGKGKRSLKKKSGLSTGFEPVTSAKPVRCSTNWAMKPHIGSKFNLLSSYFTVQWSDVKYIWNNSYLYCAVQIWIISYIFHEVLEMKSWHVSKTFEEDPKMFRWYTNEFKYNLRDKPDVTEIIDIFTCEDIVSFLSICYHSLYHWLLYNKYEIIHICTAQYKYELFHIYFMRS